MLSLITLNSWMVKDNVDSGQIICIFFIVSQISSLYCLFFLMKFFGKILKSILRFVFSIIIFVLFVGLAKMDRNVASYMSFLSNNSRLDLHRSQPANRTNSFWPHIQTTGNIADIISNENILPENAGDPTFEEEFNPITDTSLSNGSGESF
jgi:hypothetical protein